MENVYFAFLLTLLAGLSTGIGSLIAFFTKKTNKKFLSIALGFSAGVMIYVSFVEILRKSEESLMLALGEGPGRLLAFLSFFLGIVVIAVIDRFVPDYENPHQPHTKKEIKKLKDNEKFNLNDKAHLMRMGTLSAIAIIIHNFPEGLATFASALKDPTLGISIAIAIAIHNIPEGITVSVPIYYATENKKKAFLISFASGLAEPIGAIIGFLLFRAIFNDLLFGILFGFVAGIMVFISVDELLPASRKYGEEHNEIYGFMAGMGVMATSLLLF